MSVAIGHAVERRLLEVVKLKLGADGEREFREVAEHAYHQPPAGLTFSQVAAVIRLLDREHQRRAAGNAWQALSDALTALTPSADGDLSGRLIAVASRRVGQMADLVLRQACVRAGVTLDSIMPDQVPAVVAVLRRDAAVVLGAEGAEALADMLIEATAASAAIDAPVVRRLATTHLGADGEARLARLCQEQLGCVLDALNAAQLPALARVVAEQGAAQVTPRATPKLLPQIWPALDNPRQDVQRDVLALVKRRLGPLAGDFLTDVCANRDVPFAALEEEHLDWLADAVRADASAVVGAGTASQLQQDIKQAPRRAA